MLRPHAAAALIGPTATERRSHGTLGFLWNIFSRPPVTRPLSPSLSHQDERGAVGIRVLAVLPARVAGGSRAKKSLPPGGEAISPLSLSPSDLSVSRKRQTAAGRDRIKWDMTRLRARMNNSDIKPRKCVYRRECCWLRGQHP